MKKNTEQVVKEGLTKIKAALAEPIGDPTDPRKAVAVKPAAPVITPDSAIGFIQERKIILKSILDQDDIQQIQGRDFKKKSYWRKLGEVYNVSLQLIKEWKEGDGQSFTYFFVYRAVMQNGIYADGTGACSNTEKGMKRSIHDTRATAETRAKNRAISDLLSFGEVSAEEVNDINGYGQKSSPASSTRVSKQSVIDEFTKLLLGVKFPAKYQAQKDAIMDFYDNIEKHSISTIQDYMVKLQRAINMINKESKE